MRVVMINGNRPSSHDVWVGVDLGLGDGEQIDCSKPAAALLNTFPSPIGSIIGQLRAETALQTFNASCRDGVTRIKFTCVTPPEDIAARMRFALMGVTREQITLLIDVQAAEAGELEAALEALRPLLVGH